MRLKNFFQLAVLATLAFSSCKKNVDNEGANPSVSASPAQVNATAWLSNESSEARPTATAKINAVRQSLQTEKAEAVTLRKGEQLTLTPLGEGFAAKYNVASGTQAFFATLAAGGLMKGGIVLFTPDNGDRLDAKTLAAILNHEKATFSGTLKMLNIDGNRNFELTFKDGKFEKFHRYIQKQKEHATAHVGQGCIDWYLITTYTNNLTGWVTTTETYLFTVCPNACDDGSLESVCPVGDGGGGSGNGIEYEYEDFGSTAVDWVVYRNFNPTTGEDVTVRSFEILSGKRRNGDVSITGLAHTGSRVFTVGTAATYSEIQAVPNYDATSAQMTVKGQLTYPSSGGVQGSSQLVEGAHLWGPGDVRF